MSADSDKIVSGTRKWFLDLWADMCFLLWKAGFEAYNLWRAEKLVVTGGKSDEQLDQDVEASGIMDKPLHLEHP